MVTRSSIDWHGCPIRYGSAVFGDIWSLLILRDLTFKGARFYSDFLNAGEGISTNILATRLAKLEKEGIIGKRKDPDNGTRQIYFLTEKGREIIPVLLAIMDWSEKWDDKTEVPAQFAHDLRHNRDALLRKTRNALTPETGP